MKKFLVSILIFVIVSIITIFMVKINTISPAGTYVTEETLNKDITIILKQNKLENNQERIVRNNGDSYYWTYYNNGVIGKGKALFLNVSTKFGTDLKRYIEIEALMDIWIYIINRSFPYEINGITYYYKEAYKKVNPSEVYMSKEDFIAMYEQVKHLSKKEQIENLTKIYVEKSGYKRAPGHVLVDY